MHSFIDDIPRSYMSSQTDNDNDNDTLKQGLQRKSVAWPCGLEWEGRGSHDPMKKSVKLIILLSSKLCGNDTVKEQHSVSHVGREGRND